MAGKPSIKNFALKDARSGKTSKVRLQSIRLLIGRKLISPDEAERLIRALLETAKESYIRADCYELLEGLEADRPEDHRAEVDKLLAEEAARPVPSVVHKLDVEPEAPLAIAVEAAKQRMGAGTAAAARRLASKGQEEQRQQDINQLLAEEAARVVQPSGQIIQKVETSPAIKAATQSLEAGRVAKPQARASSTAQPVPAAPVGNKGPDVASKETSLVEPKPAWPYPMYWDAMIFNSQSGRGSGFDIEREMAIRQLEEQERKRAREKARDPYWGKTPLGSW